MERNVLLVFISTENNNLTLLQSPVAGPYCQGCDGGRQEWVNLCGRCSKKIIFKFFLTSATVMLAASRRIPSFRPPAVSQGGLGKMNYIVPFTFC